MRRFLLSIFVLLAMTLLVVAGCSSDSNDESEDNEENNVTESEATSGDDRTLTIAIPTDMTSQDIHDHNNTLTEAIHSNMYSYLFKRSADGDMEGDLVESYDNIDDLTWEMKLHEGVMFHNGDELTSEDVKFTLERVANDESVREYHHYRQIAEVEVVDDYNFIIKTHEPDPILLNRLSRLGSGILNKDYVDEKGLDEAFDNPVGTGPFKFVEWKKDSEIVFEAFDDYFEGKIEDWDELIFRVIPEDSTRVAELLTGGVDLALNVPDHEWNRIEENDGTRIESVTSQRVTTIL